MLPIHREILEVTSEEIKLQMLISCSIKWNNSLVLSAEERRPPLPRILNGNWTMSSHCRVARVIPYQLSCEVFVLRTGHLWVNVSLSRSCLKVHTSDHKWPRMTTSDHEWPRVDHEWPRVTTSDHEWLRETTSEIASKYLADVMMTSSLHNFIK